MKTDISIPNRIFRAAEELAKELGISLSELYADALTAYVSSHRTKGVAEQLDAVYVTGPSSVEPELIEIEIVAELNAWEAASDEALENFEKGLKTL